MKHFKFVYIPYDMNKPIQELSQELPPGKEVECLLDRLKDHFKSIKPQRTAAQLEAQQAELRRNFPNMDANSDMTSKLLDIASSMQMVETVSLLSHSRDNQFIGINMYVDDEGSLRNMPTNMRATEIAHCCGLPIEVKGDSFLARVLDDGDAFERLDFTLNEVSSSAPWVKQAQLQQEKRRQQESADVMLARMQQAPGSKSSTESAGVTLKELTPAEAAKEDGNAAFKRGDWTAAEVAYSQALDLDARLVPALNNRAMARLKLQKWKAAEEDCTAVLELDSTNVKALLRRAAAHEGVGQLEGARTDLATVLQMEPNNKEAKSRLDALNTSKT